MHMFFNCVFLTLSCSLHEAAAATGVVARELFRTQVVRAGRHCPPVGGPPGPPAPPSLPAAPPLFMEVCNVSNPRQRWDFASDGGLTLRQSPSQCVTRDPSGRIDLRMRPCYGQAGGLQPQQLWKYDAARQLVVYGPSGQGCMDTGTRATGPNPTAGLMSAGTCPVHPLPNEIFGHDTIKGWIWSNCSGANCAAPAAVFPNGRQYCMTAGTSPAPPTALSVGTDDTAEHENCIPWSIDPQNTEPGWYYDAGICGLVTTANGTLMR